MRRYLYDYIEYVDKKLMENEVDWKSFKDEHLVKIDFFQHERLIHLIVTVFYALLFLIFLGLGLLHWTFLIIAGILGAFLVCYIYHYFKLENGVQYLYKQYDIILKKLEK